MPLADVRAAAARERSRLAYEAFKVAQEAHFMALAEEARVQFLILVKDNPQIRGFSFETESVYNDEGGYDDSVTVYVALGEDQEAGTDEYWDLHDTMSGFGREPLGILCGRNSEAYEGSITLAEAKERRF